mmetsp:Transcript_37893/g.60766  ORF Transcript_37893/g.60766 Transcript_37893/m.60766 type:complete len:81 (-) Transcript_37893:330-572(-)
MLYISCVEVLSPSFGAPIEIFGCAAAAKCMSPRRDGAPSFATTKNVYEGMRYVAAEGRRRQFTIAVASAVTLQGDATGTK